MEAAKGVPYCRPMLGAAQLLSEVYASCGEEGLQCNVPCPWRSSNFQKADGPRSSLPFLLSALTYREDVVPGQECV